MAGKVQDAIEHNRRIFAQRLIAEVRAHAWHACNSGAPVRLRIGSCMHASGACPKEWAPVGEHFHAHTQSPPHACTPKANSRAAAAQDRSLLRKAMHAWAARRAASAAKRRVLERAVRRLKFKRGAEAILPRPLAPHMGGGHSVARGKSQGALEPPGPAHAHAHARSLPPPPSPQPRWRACGAAPCCGCCLRGATSSTWSTTRAP